MQIDMMMWSKFRDAGTGNDWHYDVVAKDDPTSALEVAMARQRITMWYTAMGSRAEHLDTLTRGLVDNYPGRCADGVVREIQLAAYPEAL